MSEETQPTRRNVLKKGTAATAVALGGVATIGGSASASESDATPSSIDGTLSITGYGTFTVEFEGSGLDVQANGKSLSMDEDDGVWTLEGHVNGYPNNDPNEHVYIRLDELDKVVSSESDSDVNVTFRHF
ncbi:twin-arginine translocation signal domain-containing protein [Natrialba chahannaoensis]|uniref:twin-arginine translocation signal domain-containing protein n=1 Tax=Natrialba chahannaoensis TaxID=68911 RepID=UPI0012698545|nr:twin-arginine translocation signal domain-containing protein [Natrialba chahannaoensis]